MPDTRSWNKIKDLIMEPSFEELASGARPDQVLITSEMNGGPDKTMGCTTVMDVDYADEELIFSYGMFDLGRSIGKFRTGSWSVPANHAAAASHAGYVIFKMDADRKKGPTKKRRANFMGLRMVGKRPRSCSFVPVFLVTVKDKEGEVSLDVLPEEDIVDIWGRLHGYTVVGVEEMTAQQARDRMYLMKDGTPDTSISPTAIVDDAHGNKERLLYFIGTIMEWINWGKRAREQLNGFKLEKKWTDAAWEYMWKGARKQSPPEI